NAVLYAGEVNWDATGLEGRTRTIEQALKSGDSVLVQVTKDPIGTKGARLTSHIALSGRHLVYVPHGNASGISRKLSDVERKQLLKALDRKVFLPSGGSLVIDRTEAMTVIDVNTGKYTGAGGNLEETVTRNNLEAAEEIVRQLRLRDLGGIVVIDFIDMVLESNRELVLRRLTEC